MCLLACTLGDLQVGGQSSDGPVSAAAAGLGGASDPEGLGIE